MKGFFITFEGPEKSGKSTQARLLETYLKKEGFKTVFVREPGSTVISEKIRRILLDKRHDGMAQMTEMFLYSAARAQLVEEVVRPALKRGCIVLCDRFQDSTIAYQGYGCGLPVHVITQTGRLATGGLKPDLTLLLDFWQSQEHLRNEALPDRIEMRPDAFHARVKKGYFALARQEPGRIKVVRVQDDKNRTQQYIRELVKQCLSRKSQDRKKRSSC